VREAMGTAMLIRRATLFSGRMNYLVSAWTRLEFVLPPLCDVWGVVGFEIVLESTVLATPIHGACVLLRWGASYARLSENSDA
jgi:hypothetical protein